MGTFQPEAGALHRPCMESLGFGFSVNDNGFGYIIACLLTYGIRLSVC